MNGFDIKKCLRLLILFAILFSANSLFAFENIQFIVNGVTPEMSQNIILRVNAKQNEFPITVNPRQAHFLYQMMHPEIKKAIEPYGYFRSSIQSYLLHRQNIWLAVYNVSLGTPLRIETVTTSLVGPGSQNENLRTSLRQFPLQAGDIFDVPTYNKAKTTIFKIAKNEGYLRARFDNQVLIDLHHYHAIIHFKLLTGPRFYFGPLTFKTHPYSECFMRRFILFREGDVFSSQRLIKLQQLMEKSYYFRQAIFEPDFAHIENYHVPLKAYLYAPKAQRYSLGLGYGTLTGARISGALSLRHLNDEGHHLEAEFKLSSILGGAAVNYYIPGKNPLTDEWLIGANYKRFNPKNGKSHSITTTAGYSTKTDNLHMNFNINYLLERFYAFRPHIFHTAHLFYPSWKISYLDTDDIARPHRGIFLSLNLQAASSAVLSSTTFGQATARAKLLFSPWTSSRIIFRSDLGVTAVRDLKKFPLSLRYFAGGINSIRGYPELNIGPGKYLDVFSLEYQHKMRGNLYGAVFYDIGTAANVFNKHVRSSAGIGAVYDSAVGPIKAYIARPFNRRKKVISFDFSLGPEFA